MNRLFLIIIIIFIISCSTTNKSGYQSLHIFNSPNEFSLTALLYDYYKTNQNWPENILQMNKFAIESSKQIDWNKFKDINIFSDNDSSIKLKYYDIPQYIINSHNEYKKEDYVKNIFLKIPTEEDYQKVNIYYHTINLLKKYNLNYMLPLKIIYFDISKKMWILEFDDPLVIDEGFKIIIIDEKVNEFEYQSIMWSNSIKYGG